MDIDKELQLAAKQKELARLKRIAIASLDREDMKREFLCVREIGRLERDLGLSPGLNDHLH